MALDEDALEARRTRLRSQAPDGSIRGYAGKGVLVNAVWSIGLQTVQFLRGFIVAAFLAPGDYGVWALIAVGYTTLLRLKAVGISDKYIQQDGEDDEVAFQKAFTLEAILLGGFWLVCIAATPLMALAYRAPEIIAPGFVALLAVPAAVLQTPVWTFQRDMDFSRMRRLTAVDPLIAAIVTIVLAVAGYGFWAFAIGNVFGAWAGAIAVMRDAPYPLRWRYDKGTAREYVRFSTPVLYANLSNIILLQATILCARSAVGIAGIGALSLANSIRNYTEFADRIVSSTMYPAICAAKDRRDLLYESFIKSNRLALMWGFPFGMSMVLFASDLVHYLLGDEWQFAVPLFQAVGAITAIGHIAFNWDSYIRALGDTKPIAKYAWYNLLGWAAGPLPLIFIDGLRGYGIGLFVVSALSIWLRSHFLRQLFPEFRLLRHGLRAVVSTIPAFAAVGALRLVETGPRALYVVGAELVVYAGLTAGMVWLTERRLVREAYSYLRRGRGRSPLGLATP